MSEPSPTPTESPQGSEPTLAGEPATGREPASGAGPAPASGPRGLLARYWWVAGLSIAGVVAVLASAFASSDPDGLDSVAIEQGFEGAGKDPGFQVLPDYTIPGLDGTTSTIVAGIVGIAIVFLLVFLLGRLLARRRKGTAA
jgi:cobalt/nickel transport system permease protein